MDEIVQDRFNPDARPFKANIIRREKVEIVFELHAGPPGKDCSVEQA
jgi:hypothetical protein